MTDVQKIKCIRAIYDKMKEVAAIDFQAYGSLYFANFAPPQTSPKVRVDEQFCIGIHCGNRYWG